MNSSTRTPDDFQRRRKAKWVSYIIGGVIFQIFIILVLLYIILRVRSVKVHLDSPKVENLRASNETFKSPSFSMSLHTQVIIKNSNFGHYKFENSSVVLAYRGTHVGEASFKNGWVKSRSVKKIDVVVAVSLKSWMSGYGGLGKITLTANAHVVGKLQMLKVIRRRKLVQMHCTMDVHINTKAIDNVHCK